MIAGPSNPRLNCLIARLLFDGTNSTRENLDVPAQRTREESGRELFQRDTAPRLSEAKRRRYLWGTQTASPLPRAGRCLDSFEAITNAR